MATRPSLASPIAAPAGAEADRAESANPLLLFIIRLFITWAEELAASLQQRAETTDLTHLIRAFGTSDTALILERITCGLQRLRALEDKVLSRTAGRDTNPPPEPLSAVASPRTPFARHTHCLTPQAVHRLLAATPQRVHAAPVRATGPPATPRSVRTSQRGLSILSHRGAWPAPSCRFREAALSAWSKPARATREAPKPYLRAAP